MFDMSRLQSLCLQSGSVLHHFLCKWYTLIILPPLYGLGLSNIDPFHYMSSLPAPLWQSCLIYALIFQLSYAFMYHLLPLMLRHSPDNSSRQLKSKLLRLLALWALVSFLLFVYKVSINAIHCSWLIEFPKTLGRTMAFGMPFYLLSKLGLRYIGEQLGLLRIALSAPPETVAAVAVPEDYLLYVTSKNNNKTMYYWTNGQQRIENMRMSLVEVKDFFKEKVVFMDCSRSCIVNIDMIDLNASRQLKNTIVLKYIQVCIPVRDTYQQAVRIYLKEHTVGVKKEKKPGKPPASR